MLEVLASLTELTRLEDEIGLMIDREDSFYTLLLLTLRDKIEALETSDRAAHRLVRWADSPSTKLVNEMLDASDTEAITRTRIEAVVENRSRADKNITLLHNTFDDE